MKIIISALILTLTSCATTNHRSNRFCAVVRDVRYGKTKANIRPEGLRSWFRYPNLNIHIGDTVELSMNDRIEPKF
jgi:hypothetical protein